MKKRSGQEISRRRAIQNTLARLGMQASNGQVVAALASFGIDATEWLVQQVRIQNQKDAARVERQQVRVPVRTVRVQRPPKMPRRRSNGR
jgi:hypothetical protein